MIGPDQIATPARPRFRGSRFRGFSLFLRRSHMYLALFLTPWMLMYALSTLIFNHYERITRHYGGEIDRFEKERELAYTRSFPPRAAPREKAEQILEDFGLRGSLRIDQRVDDRLVFTRTDPVTPRRITYLPAEQKLVIEKGTFRTPSLLTGLHSRVGYGSRYPAARAWAFGVDLTVFSTFLWIGSGFWLCWELKSTRRWGVFFAALGVALFGLFLLIA